MSVFPAPKNFSITGIGVSISLMLWLPTVVIHNSSNHRYLSAASICFLVESIIIPAGCLKNICCFPLFLPVESLCWSFSWCLMIWGFTKFPLSQTPLVQLLFLHAVTLGCCYFILSIIPFWTTHVTSSVNILTFHYDYDWFHVTVWPL